MTNNISNINSYTECFIAFIDILGFENLVNKSIEDKDILKRLNKAVNFLAAPSSGTKESRHVDEEGNGKLMGQPPLNNPVKKKSTGGQNDKS